MLKIFINIAKFVKRDVKFENLKYVTKICAFINSKINANI